MTDKKTDAADVAELASIEQNGRDTIHGSVIEQVRALVEDYARPRLAEITDPMTNTVSVALVSNNVVQPIPATVFDDYLTAPRRRRGTAEMLSLDSLIEHTNRFKDGDSAIFADDDRSAPSITTMLDYHRAGATADPRFGKHRGHFAFPLSDEWKAWMTCNAQAMSMVDFAAFLEDRVIDVVHLIPDEDELSEDLKKFIAAGGNDGIIATPQRLVELSRGLVVNENSVVREVQRLASGEAQIMFTSEHTDANGEQLRVPNLFIIAIPVFRNGPFYRLAARLRYRKSPAGIVFWYDLWRTDRTFDHAFRESCERVRVETDLPLFIGRPE